MKQMRLPVKAYLEGVARLNDSFSMLGDIYPVTDASGSPVFYVTNRTAVFAMKRNGTDITLTVPLNTDEFHGSDIALRCTDSSQADFFVSAQFCPSSLEVVTDDGKRFYCDVLLQDSFPTLHDYIRLNSAAKRRQALRNALEGVAKAAADLSGSGFTHGGLTLRNICFDNSGRLRLTDYALGGRGDRNNDLAALSKTAVLLYLAGCDHLIYRRIMDAGIKSGLAGRTRRRIISAAEYYGIEPLAELLKSCDGSRISAEACIGAIRKLSVAPFTDMPVLIKMLDDGTSEPLYASWPAKPHRTAASVDFAECEQVWPASDMVVRFVRNGEVGYAEPSGQRIVVDKALWGGFDFYEGRAVVRSDDGYGLIDRSGRWIMRDRWSDMTWYGPENIVAAADSKGVWHIFDRSGRQLSSVGCDWFGECSEGFLVGRKGN